MLAGWLAAVAGCLNGCAAGWLRCWLATPTGWASGLAAQADWLAGQGGWAGCTGWTFRAGWLLGDSFSFGPCLAHLGFGLILGDAFGPCWALGLGPMGPSNHPVYGVPCNHPSCRGPFNHPVYGVLFHHPVNGSPFSHPVYWGPFNNRAHGGTFSV